MKIEDKYPKLDSLFGAYFNQDWDLDYDTPEEVVKAFAHMGGKSHIEQTIFELKHLLKEHHTKMEWYYIISDEFGCEYSLRLRNIDPREWLMKILKQFEEELPLAKNDCEAINFVI